MLGVARLSHDRDVYTTTARGLRARRYLRHRYDLVVHRGLRGSRGYVESQHVSDSEYESAG
jgi:hypothetical protein